MAEDSGPIATVRVLLPLPLADAYDYAVPDGMDLPPGAYVEVPLGRLQRIGVVWGPGSGQVARSRLKQVAHRFDLPPLPEVARSFVDRVARYTVSPPGAVLRMSLSSTGALEPPKPVLAYRRAGMPPEGVKLSAARRRVLAVLEDGPPRLPAELAREAGCGGSVVKGMAEAGLLEVVLLPGFDPVPQPDLARPRANLGETQREVADTLIDTVAIDGYSTTLIDGVTGSGKTEVYFEAVAAALARGRQVLVLLPEIALSGHWLDRFAARFGVRPVEWHSELTPVQRRRNWRAVALGEARVVVGARSALFLPYAELGLIVVDEEHESAFKQEDGVVYQARDMAVLRGHLGGFPVILVSATPSLETLANVEAGRYAVQHLPDRHGVAQMPAVTAIDMRRESPARGRFLSPTLREAVAETLAKGEQAMLFLNRRGYAPLTLCRHCGHRMECPNCTAWLVEHRLAGRLECHHCGHRAALPKTCPSCQSESSFAACGPGVERIAEEVDATLPEARWTIVASDTFSGPQAIADLTADLDSGAVNLLIGTQILAKGHNFPGLTLVGVVDADLGLAGGDLRAAERTWQLLHQVGGRAGRAEKPGRVLLQSFMPDHPVMQTLVANDRDGFLASEAEARRSRGLPPYGKLVALIVSGPDRGAVDRVARELGQAAPQGDGIMVLGPAEAPLALLRGRHRRRLLFKADRRIAVQPLVTEWVARVQVPGIVRVQIDIDPYSFL
ncbi:primosomal protein N' (replication factor Y) [Inquilinus ginsengisoli]|uniref:Replication restart protein PriA n=1 Tax=Inquilinus ginsengisoli TaxID=363840 RepID=A0ABU1JSW4_9PROT|nr:primosomal protein N' [Inquilinus ginsengisoli]MDR6291703.1 primosomal protein N' (replication factor Y) [Inquilinus ginsengisoli]